MCASKPFSSSRSTRLSRPFRAGRFLSVLLIPLIVICGLNFSRLAATAQPTSQTAKQSRPNLRGQQAIEQLKQQGLYSSLQQAMAATRYKAEWEAQTTPAGVGGAYELMNEAHNLRAYVAASELRVIPLSPDALRSWQLGMKLVGYGCGDSLSSITASEITAKENRVEIKKSAIKNPQSAIVEWYVNTEEGIEQGFDIAAAPANKQKGEPLRLTLELTGNLDAKLDAERQSIAFSDCRTSLTYSGLEASDARGQRLVASMELEPGRVTLAIDDTKAEYPLTINSLLAQQVRLRASDASPNDRFGASVAISGDTVVVGSYGDNVGAGSFQGSAYVFVHSGTTWSQQQKLTASDGAPDDRFGYSVGISGDTVVVGSYGANAYQGSAYVFVRSGTTWSQQQKLTASDGAADDYFGHSVCIDGDTVVVGAGEDDVGANANQGSAYVFVRSGTTWQQQQKLTAIDGATIDQFGISVSISGNTTVVGAFGANVDRGSAYVFVRSGTTWMHQQQLIASDGDASDAFGVSVAISGDTVVVGANQDDVGANLHQGSAYVFVRSGATWWQQQKLTAIDGVANRVFGSSVAISGDTAIVGSASDQVFPVLGLYPGSAYAFVRTGTSWSQQKLTASDGAFQDLFGASVAISGATVVVGASYDDVGASFDQGSAYLFTCGRTEQTEVLADDGATGDEFGSSVSVSGDTVVVGAPFDDVALTNEGSAYVFVRNGFGWTQQAKLTASDAATGALFGFSVSISGDTALVGAYLDDEGFANQGSAYVFVRNGTTWSEEAKLTASDGAANDEFGHSVSISADTVVVGAPLDDVGFSDQGSAYVFERSGTTWSQQGPKLTASDGAAGDQFGGYSVNISGDTVIVGSFLDDHVGGFDQGSAYVFVRNLDTWSEEAKLTASDGLTLDEFGFSVAITGDTAVVGAPLDDVGFSDQGSAYVFVRSGTTWSQQGPKLTASDGALDDFFGISVAVSGTTILVGSIFGDVGSPAIADQGSAYVFTPVLNQTGAIWSQQQKLIANDGWSNDNFGIRVSISGDIVVVGAYHDDIPGNPDPKMDQGSAYIFFGGCNNAPTATPANEITLQQGSPASMATLASVSDLEDASGSLVITATSIPSGITLTGLTNANGTVTASVAANCTAALGAQSITIQTQDSGGASSTANVTVNVTADSAPTLGDYPATSVPTGGSATVTPNAGPADNGSMSFAISIPGYLGGYTFNPFTGVLSLNNASPQGVYPVTVTATDNCGFVTATAFPLTVGAVITINPSTVPNGAVSVAYNQALTAMGGTSPYAFGVISGTLPPGLSLSSSGALSGTPTNGGNFNFTVRATDSSATHDTGNRAYSLVISGPTSINLISFDATGYDDGVFISWQTGYEVNNLGFNIHRDDGGKLTPVNAQLIAGSALVVGQGVELRSGYSYKWWDSKPGGAATRYWIEDVDLNGEATWHGPFVLATSGDKQRPAPIEQSKLLAVLGETERDSKPVEPRATLARASSSERQFLPPIPSGGAVKIGIEDTGWYRVTQPELIAAGLDPALDPRRLQMLVDGRELAISVDGEGDGRLDAGDAVEFYAVAVDSPYSSSRILWLVGGKGAGRRITTLKSEAHPATGGSFEFTVERRDRSIYFAALRNGERENFFGSVVHTQPLNQAFTVRHLDTQSAVGAGLEVALQGVTASPHWVTIQLNGSTIGSLMFEGVENKIAYLRVSLSLLTEGRNTVTLRTTGNPSDVSLVDYVRLTYQHTYVADEDRLLFTADEQQQVTITGFSSKLIRVFDVTNAESLQELAGEIVEQERGYAVAVQVAGAGERALLAVTEESARRSANVVADSPSDLRGSANLADLLIVSHRNFIDQARLLTDLRRKEGLSVMVVDVEDVYDEFSYGQKTPYALSDFLLFAKANWKKPPLYLLLFGDASYDAKNYLGPGEYDLLPTKLIDTVFMESASDDWFAEFDGDGIADISVGRLPARTNVDAEVMIKKIIGYGQAPTSQETLLAADANDGYDFEGAIDTLRSLVPANLRITEVKRGQLGDATAKAVLLQALARGQKLAAYSGHGSANSWRGNLLTNADASALTNSGRLTVFVMMNCLNGYFHDPQSDSLAEALLKADQGGAIAVWASSAMTFPDGQSLMNQSLYRLLFGTANLRLGDAVRISKTATQEIDARRTWILLGDPTMRLR